MMEGRGLAENVSDINPGNVESQVSATHAVETSVQPPISSLIEESGADAVVERRQEREKHLINAFEYNERSGREQMEQRYGVGEDRNWLTNFLGRTKAWFAGEYSDLSRAKVITKRSLEARSQGKEFDEYKEASKWWQQTHKETARNVTKILIKTGVTGGIGAGITACLGGTVFGPAFLGAVIGGAAARGVAEVIRAVNPKEREARTRLLLARIDSYKSAMFLQQEMSRFQEALAATNDAGEQQEIQRNIDGLYETLINISQEHTHMAVYQWKGEQVQQLRSEAVAEKMKLQRRNEKYADLAAAVGAVGGGIIGGQIAQSQLLGQKAAEIGTEQVQSWTANYDGDKISHVVRHINPQDIVQSTGIFEQSLAKSGGYVFEYSHTEMARELGQHVSTATLRDGTVVHALGGIPSDAAVHLSKIATPEIAQSAGIWAAHLLKEVVPIAAANLVFSLFIPSIGFGSNEKLQAERDLQDRFRPGQEVYFKGEKFEIGKVRTRGIRIGSESREKRQYELVHWIRGERQPPILVDEEELITNQPKRERVGFRDKQESVVTPPQPPTARAEDSIIDAEFAEDTASHTELTQVTPPPVVAPPVHPPPVVPPPTVNPEATTDLPDAILSSQTSPTPDTSQAPDTEPAVEAETQPEKIDKPEHRQSPEVIAFEALSRVIRALPLEDQQKAGLALTEDGTLEYQPEGARKLTLGVKEFGDNQIIQSVRTNDRGQTVWEIRRGADLRTLLQEIKDKLRKLEVPAFATKLGTHPIGVEPEVTIEPTTAPTELPAEIKPSEAIQNLMTKYGIEDGAEALIGNSVHFALDSTNPIEQSLAASLASQLDVEELPDDLSFVVDGISPKLSADNQIYNYTVTLRHGEGAAAKKADVPLTTLLGILGK